MAKQGYKFTKKSIGYEFQPGTPENAVIKMDYRTFIKQEDFEDYCTLFADCGWKNITSTKSSGYQYFKSIDGGENIFSDADSKAGRYKRISQMWIALALLNPKLLYFTPGLWEKSGAALWGALLFETPFAFFRGFFWLLLPIMIVLYLIFAFKANQQYQKNQKDKYEN